MSTEQHDADAYGQELARISHHQHEAMAARFTVFQALAAAGIGHEQADDIVAKLEAGAVAGAHTWISESTAPHGSEPRFEDGWHAGVRDVASYLLRIADTTATTGRGRAASSAMLAAHLQRPDSPCSARRPATNTTPYTPPTPSTPPAPTHPHSSPSAPASTTAQAPRSPSTSPSEPSPLSPRPAPDQPSAPRRPTHPPTGPPTPPCAAPNTYASPGSPTRPPPGSLQQRGLTAPTSPPSATKHPCCSHPEPHQDHQAQLPAHTAHTTAAARLFAGDQPLVPVTGDTNSRRTTSLRRPLDPVRRQPAAGPGRVDGNLHGRRPATGSPQAGPSRPATVAAAGTASAHSSELPRARTAPDGGVRVQAARVRQDGTAMPRVALPTGHEAGLQSVVRPFDARQSQAQLPGHRLTAPAAGPPSSPCRHGALAL
ncbi:hypothetical protein SUDANB180_07811 (plasmid) [Streptomyces sp. enrichment culture]